MKETKIKICGLFRPCDADFVNEAVPDYAGFVFYPQSPRYVTDAQAAALRARLSPAIVTVGVFVDEAPEHICRLYHEGSIQIIQLHGREDTAYIAQLRAMLPEAEIWKAFRVRSAADMDAARICTTDKVLLDNGYGTGQCFDWSLIKSFEWSMILAGGLSPENIQIAIERFHPWAVDLSSGVEENGVKSREKIKLAVAAAKGR